MVALVLFMSGHASAHQWIPTYPKLKQSFVPNVLVTTMELFNSRSDVEYYEISVLDKNMDPMKFATTNRVIQVPHLKRENVDVYIRAQDADKAVYICSTSKILKESVSATVVSSRICSKIK